jgi:hypothetical protein
MKSALFAKVTDPSYEWQSTLADIVKVIHANRKDCMLNRFWRERIGVLRGYQQAG